MNVTGVDFIALPTQDFERSRAFYRDVLGLEESKRWGDMPAMEFETANLTVAIMQSDAFGRPFAPHTQPVAFQVDDVESTQKELEGHGVEFQMDTTDTGVCHMAVFTDPDGNPLMIHKRHPNQT